MTNILIGFLVLVFSVLLITNRLNIGAIAKLGPVGRSFVSIIGFITGIILLGSSSFVFIDANKIGHLKLIYGFQDLPKGRIIALNGQKGPQARILGPGFHLIPFVRVLYDVEERSVVTIPEGYYGELTALDGKRMPAGMFIAPKIEDDKIADMLDAETFINGGGYKGPQETVLKPGSYRINQYLFSIKANKDTRATIIPAGHVGVVKSNVKTPGTVCVEEKVSAASERGKIEDALTVPLVPRGCVGIWREPLFPGAYYLNKKAYDVTLVDTRVKTWVYKGGYTKRLIELQLDQNGNIQQKQRSERLNVPTNAADRAVFVKVEGWDIPQELRVLVQVSPKNAPIVVGAVGGLDEIENKILTPVIRSIVRNVAGSEIELPDSEDPTKFIRRPTRVLDLLENRDALEKTIETLVKIEGLKAGVDIKEIRLGEPALPPELLVSRLRQQLADQLSITYSRETAAQEKRIETEQARSTANEQPRLVAAQIAVKVAKQREEERAALGRAEKQYLEELARGQSAQANVLGKDRVALLQALDKILSSLEKQPDLVKIVGKLVPHTVVNGSGDGLTGAAAVLGNALKPKGSEKKSE